MVSDDDISGAPASVFHSLQRRLATGWRRDLIFFAIAITVVALDQVTKWIVRSNLDYGETWPEDSDALFRIIHVTNSGAAFGILEGQTLFLIVTSLIGLGAIILYYIYPPMEHGLIRVALGMQLGGAAGNLTDRVRLGEVTDFIDVGSFPTFNVADSSISVSIVAVLIFFLFEEAAEKRRRPPDAAPASSADE